MADHLTPTPRSPRLSTENRESTVGHSKSPLDWSAIHRRLEAIQQAIEGGGKRTPEEKKQVLRARAQALARESTRKETAGQTCEVLEFLVAHERYAIEVQDVREVYPLKDLTPLPGTPAFILGVTNVRGQVLLIVDIKKLFGLPDKGLTDLNKIIIVQAPGVELGVLADNVLGLESVRMDDLQTSLPTLTGVREEFLRGVTRSSLVVLDAKKLLSVSKTGWEGTGA
jgi:purine-binding chemotaxis protein CheW